MVFDEDDVLSVVSIDDMLHEMGVSVPLFVHCSSKALNSLIQLYSFPGYFLTF